MTDCDGPVEALRRICNARSLMVVGASSDPSKFGYALVETLLKGEYSGEIFLVNRKAEQILGRRVYPSIREIPGKVELALVIIPAADIPQTLTDAAGKGVREAVIYSSGYRELGHPEREAELRTLCRQIGVRFLGPNIQGMIYVPNRLSAMFWPAITKEGPLAVVTQSGSVTAGLAEMAVRDGLGISAAINLGNQVDLCDADVLEFLGQDERTQTIMMYLEGVKDGRRFMDVVRRVSRSKGVALLKAGRSTGGRNSAASHTGSLAGNDDVFSGVCRQFGAVRADDMASLYDAAKALATMRNPCGRRVFIVSSSGGGNTLAADEAERQGLVLPELPASLLGELNRIGCPPNAHLSNPADLAGVRADHFEKAVLLADQWNLADFYLLAFCDPVPGSTELAIRLAQRTHAQVVVTYFGGGELELTSRLEIQSAGIPVYPTPEQAMRGIAAAVWAAERRRVEEGN
jgi:acyl-CoA synthetase (NDP forming)